MCRIEEKIYVGTDGDQSRFEDIIQCDKGRYRGEACPDSTVRTTKYHDPQDGFASEDGKNLRSNIGDSKEKPSTVHSQSLRNNPKDAGTESDLKSGNKRDELKAKTPAELSRPTIQTGYSEDERWRVSDTPAWTGFQLQVREGTPVVGRHEGSLQAEPINSQFEYRRSEDGDLVGVGEFVERRPELTATGTLLDALKELNLSEDSTDEEAKERRYRRKKKRWSAGLFKRTHDQAVGHDSSYSDDEPQDDNIPEARRLRRKVRRVVRLDERVLPVGEEEGISGTSNTNESDLDGPPSLFEEVKPYSGRKQHQPTQGDWVLIREMDPNRSDIAQAISRELALDSNSDAYTQPSESDDEGVSLCAESIFSQESTRSSATGASAATGYTDAEIKTATKELVSIFLEDTVTTQLYQCAFDNPCIGPDRLQRNLYRLLKKYSQNLHHEAQGKLERLASQFVAVKARYVAQCVMEEFHVKPTLQRQRQNQAKADDSDQEDAQEEDKIPPIDEDRFEDIAVLHQFLVGSAAFGMFQEQLKSFVQPKHSQPSPGKDMLLNEENCKTETTTPAMQPTATEQLSETASPNSNIPLGWLERAQHSRNNLLVAMELLEPRLPPGMTRLRWSCRCGDSFYSDIFEYRPGGIDRLKKQMQGSGCLKVAATSYNQGTPEQRYKFEAPAWLRSATKRLSSTLTQASQDTSCLPQHHTSSVSQPAAAPQPSPSADRRELYLMACMHRTEHHVVVVQDEITNISTDRQLFHFLRTQLARHRGYLNSIISMRRVQRIYFVKFFLNKGHRAQVRHHRTCCTSSRCDCIPPQLKVVKPPVGSGEYECNPAGPPDTWPPICPEFMMHMLYAPDCLDEDDAYVLGQLPKKTDGKLQEVIGTPTEGWGLYLQEDVDISTLLGIVFIVLFLASLLFLILWTVLKDDIQGGSGVSACILAVASMLGIWIATRSRSFG
ncbi:uncharacterized protein EKO05_0004383 [Ascochyta rabiei]|uniref:uncharacterized protein n=1 Tax=Didymella rabiei TaxID=5454 RepID=UPI001901A20B|nr:uncharacterized protein EKO05_0004383 [Ascochyta rabiei]UPX13887.1 hypothetical protein EKO05_0004383 [Ascochyta rabiei]